MPSTQTDYQPALATQQSAQPRLAVVIPCLNEAAAIGKVVSDFQQHLPQAEIYVYDNCSDDGTAEAARTAGARVRVEPRRGKGHVMRRMFADVDADIYVLVDGDNTYDATAAPGMVERLLVDRLDMVVGRRIADSDMTERHGHKMGNRVLTGFVSSLFNRELKDMLSGYRVMSRRFVKSFPVSAGGFQIETELTIHTLQVDAPFAEVDIRYSQRDVGSVSKLRTIPDGLLVLGVMLKLLAFERPMNVFGGAGVGALIVAALTFAPVLRDFLELGTVPRFPTLIASTAVMLSGFTSIFAGIILFGVAHVGRNVKRLAYLAQPSMDEILGKRD